ncbi:HNH endonuclease [Aeoliella sp. ICT_H6.2]|uniref:HNH endonuclease n=1 Tax=Aeoliella straminimaris TaxID=2954799 RepID=A0A9X2FE59_9BACT|nr:HNH endonuclease signature motif containing protein [Aeoliella straminimaris]MCO6046523.1 HNH endonuclease [Aeoliella straminimaris]
MAKNRVEIDETLAAEVMFASDHTCCICRREKRVQIHHIDENPSNNDFDNLAVTCLLCHSDAHSKGGFVRRYSAEEIRLYNRSWREIAESRLVLMKDMPVKESKKLETLELAREALLSIQLSCIVFRGSLVATGKVHAVDDEDGWTRIIRQLPVYTRSNYEDWQPVFVDSIETVLRDIEQIETLYGDVLPLSTRLLIVRSKRQLLGEVSGYQLIPKMLDGGHLDSDSAAKFFGFRVRGCMETMKSLEADLATTSNELTKSLVDDSGPDESHKA